MKANNVYSRQWQKDALPGYVERFNKQKTELTVAYQGTGKTLYTATCFVASVLGDPGISSLSTKEISRQFNQYKGKTEHFAIIFIPAKSIIESTIEDWESVGVKVARLENEKLKKTSLTVLIEQGYNGIICLYQQVVKNDVLGSLMKQLPDTIFHAVLDECHELRIGGEKPPNLRAKYFIHNQSRFCKLHMITGTPVKQGYKTSYADDSALKIPFAQYLETGEVVPNTFYSQEDAIKDGVIVQTTPVIYSIANLETEIDGVKHSLTNEDINWLIENCSPSVFKYSNHPKHEKLRRFLAIFNAVCGSLELWKNLLKYGDAYLTKTRRVYPLSKGIIFTPSQESAINIHKNLLNGRSILCVSEKGEIGKNDFTGCNYVKSDKVRSYLKQSGENIDWIVSCEALMQGFNYPDCKVSIVIPRLQFLHLTKISQIIGRTNRAIKGFPDLQATCITLDCKPLEELVKLSQNSRFGIYGNNNYTSNIIEIYSLDAVEKAIEKVYAHEQGREIIKKDIKVTDVMMSAISKTINPDGTIIYSHNTQLLEQLTEENIRTYWVNYSLIIHNTPGLTSEEIPPQEPGIYIIVNAKTQEYLYVGSSDNLRARTTDKRRYIKDFKWIPTEGVDNIYIKWIVTDSYQDQEDITKDELNPKYNKEKTRNDSIIKSSAYKRWKKMWNHGKAN